MQILYRHKYLQTRNVYRFYVLLYLGSRNIILTRRHSIGILKKLSNSFMCLYVCRCVCICVYILIELGVKQVDK